MVIPPSAIDQPLPIERTPVQQSTDLDHLKSMGERFGHVFYIEPGPAPGTTSPTGVRPIAPACLNARCRSTSGRKPTSSRSASPTTGLPRRSSMTRSRTTPQYEVAGDDFRQYASASAGIDAGAADAIAQRAHDAARSERGRARPSRKPTRGHRGSPTSPSTAWRPRRANSTRFATAAC